MKYLELFKNGFGETLTEKIKPENWPYVGYSPNNGLLFTAIPEPVADGPADNEIWYTDSNGTVVNPYKTDRFGANIVGNSYENGKGIITFDGGVTSIGGQAFWKCSSLTSITIPNSVTSIGNDAFSWSSSLTSVTIPTGVTRIGHNAFVECRSLTSVTIYNNVTSIGEWAFAHCTSLTLITFEGTMEEWNSIKKEYGWKDNVPATYVQCTDGQVTF